MEYLQFRKLLEYQDILTHGYSLKTHNRNYKTTSNDLREEQFKKVIQNYRIFCDSLNCDYKDIIKPTQKHTDVVKIVNQKTNKNLPDMNIKSLEYTDGLITNKKNRVLSTTNADCILLVFFDPVKKVIANVHSGWRGTLQKISVNCINQMISEYACDPGDIICCICPSIRVCHFEVKEDVRKPFFDTFVDRKEINDIIISKTKENKISFYIDTVLINKVLLMEKGLQEKNIIDSNICSVCNSELIHSFRVEKENFGLGTALIGLK